MRSAVCVEFSCFAITLPVKTTSPSFLLASIRSASITIGAFERVPLAGPPALEPSGAADRAGAFAGGALVGALPAGGAGAGVAGFGVGVPPGPHAGPVSKRTAANATPGSVGRVVMIRPSGRRRG